MPSSGKFVCPKCGTAASIKQIKANGYACPNRKCVLNERLLVHGEINTSGVVAKLYGWILKKGTILKKRYLIESLIGKGGFGATYLAKDKKMFNQLRAIKEIPDAFFDEKEDEFLTILNHPAIPKLYERFSVGSLHYSVMEYVEGKDLQELTHKLKGGMLESVVLQLMEQIFDVLSYIHSQKVIHRDLKPENILVKKDNSIALIDFGIAKKFIAGQRTRYLARAASNFYSSPEQYHPGKGYTDIKSDIYSLGAILYFILTGREPTDALSRDKSKDIYPLPRNLNPNISSGTEQVIIKAMKMNKTDRFSSIRQMKEALLGKDRFNKKVCLKCGKILDGPGNYCPNCGHSTNSKKSHSTKSFVFRSGNTATNLQQFIKLCYLNWDDAKWHLFHGDFELWLTLIGEKTLARKAKSLKTSTVDYDKVLNNFLLSTKYGLAPKLAIKSDKLEWTNVSKGVTKKAIINIQNEGKGYLVGHLKSPVKWLEFNKTSFGCLEGRKASIALSINTRVLSLYKTHKTSIIISSNGGHKKLPVVIRVIKPAPRIQIAPQSLNIELNKGQAAKASFLVRNIGNDEKVKARVATPQRWIGLYPKKFNEKEKKINVGITTRRLKEGKHSGRVIVASNLGARQVSVNLRVKSAGRNGSFWGKPVGQILRSQLKPMLIAIAMMLLICHFGPTSKPSFSEIWFIIFAGMIGGVLGLTRNLFAMMIGFFIGSGAGLVLNILVFYVFHFIQNDIIHPFYSHLSIKLNTHAIYTIWGLIGLYLGGLIGLVKSAVDTRQRAKIFIIFLIIFTAIILIIFILFPLIIFRI